MRDHFTKRVKYGQRDMDSSCESPSSVIHFQHSASPEIFEPRESVASCTNDVEDMDFVKSIADALDTMGEFDMVESIMSDTNDMDLEELLSLSLDFESTACFGESCPCSGSCECPSSRMSPASFPDSSLEFHDSFPSSLSNEGMHSASVDFVVDNGEDSINSLPEIRASDNNLASETAPQFASIQTVQQRTSFSVGNGKQEEMQHDLSRRSEEDAWPKEEYRRLDEGMTTSEDDENNQQQGELQPGSSRAASPSARSKRPTEEDSRLEEGITASAGNKSDANKFDELNVKEAQLQHDSSRTDIPSKKRMQKWPKEEDKNSEEGTTALPDSKDDANKHEENNVKEAELHNDSSRTKINQYQSRTGISSKKQKKQKWSKEEDRRLQEGIKLYKLPNWKLIARHVRTRNNKMCAQRWRHALRPELKVTRKGKWTKKEDKKLIEILSKETRKNERTWDRASEAMGFTRNGLQCRERWNNFLDPSLRFEPWTAEEDACLLLLHAECGNKWQKFTTTLVGRSPQRIRRRLAKLKRKKYVSSN